MRRKFLLFLSKITPFCKSYIELCIWLLFFAIGIRFFEAILFSRMNHSFSSSILWNFTGLCFDISLWLRISVWFLIVFVAVCLLHERITRIIFRILLSLLLLLSLICILFYMTSGFLLDKVVFTYSLKEIISIIQSSSKTPYWVYMVLALLPVLFFYVSGKRIKINNGWLILFAVLILSSFFICRNLPPDAEHYFVKKNKTHFFMKSVFVKITFRQNAMDILKEIEEFRSYFPEHNFCETEYPFLHQANDKDVLSPFFNLKSTPPNFVFIIIEGMAYEYFHTDYDAMPFLNSLSKKSLQWEQCLSVSPRTFGVLPALFASVQLGKRGFLSLCPNNPEYHSLLRILNQNDYTTNFFYGGDITFDNMKCFLEQNNMIYLNESDWDNDIKTESIHSKWGYEDHLLYKQAMRKINQQAANPRVDVYLTVTTHIPWEYPRSSYYQNRLKKNVIQSKSLSKKEITHILDWVHEYAGFEYADWAVEQLIEDYKKREDFDNTIFIITGDHHSGPDHLRGYRNYHVPLIIYSPMLKSGRYMKGVVSHRDITPTLLSLLKNKYNIKAPEDVAWLNSAMDTSLTFNANTFSPLQIINHTLDGMLYKNYLLSENIVAELTENGPRVINDQDILTQMTRMLTLYQSIERNILYNNALIRNNDFRKRKQAETIISIEDSISKNSFFAKESKLKVCEGPEGRDTTLYFHNSNLYPIKFLTYEIPNHEIEQLIVEVEFKIYIKNDDKNKELRLIMDLTDNEKSASYETEYLDAEKQNKWVTVRKMMFYKKELFRVFEKKFKLSVYLWNKDEVEGYIDDIQVKVKAY